MTTTICIAALAVCALFILNLHRKKAEERARQRVYRTTATRITRAAR